MTPPPNPVDIEALLDHAEWIRRLARGLVLDSAGADDVVQETWAVALQRPPARADNPRGWLGKVGSNVARQMRRAEGRRQRREREVSRPEAQPQTHELAAMQRDVLGHVLGLDEPFRGTVLLRFFEDLPPREIAARQGVPVKTVHSRLARAFEKLRTRLDDEYGDRSSWKALFGPLLAISPTTHPTHPLTPKTGWPELTLIMNLNTKIGIALVATVLGGFGLLNFISEEPGELEALSTNEPVSQTGESLSSTSVDESTRIVLASDEVESAPSSEPEAPLAAATVVRVRGRVIDLAGEPLAGVAISSDRSPDTELGVTSADGSFEVELADPFDPKLGSVSTRLANLRVVDDNLTTICESSITQTNHMRDHVIVAASCIDLEGVVVDEGMAPIAAASIAVQPGIAFVGFPYPLDMARFVRPRTIADKAGEFTLESVPTSAGLQLHVGAEGYNSVLLDLETLTPGGLVVELTPRTDNGEAFVEGIVIDETGIPVEGALVKLANESLRTPATGRFRLPVGFLAETTPLCAVKQGRLPALVPDFGRIFEEHGREVPLQELVLGGEPLVIGGRVTDWNGEPLEGWKVSISDETAVSQHRFPLETAEGYARRGAASKTTKENGEFKLTGLLPREYRVQAYHPKTLQRIEAVEVAAGNEDLELRVPEDSFYPELRGTVRTRAGLRVANANVRICLDTAKTDYGSSFVQGRRTVTDEVGSFVLESVPREHVYLRISGETFMPASFELDSTRALSDLQIEVSARCHFRVEPADPSRPAVSVDFLAADGRSLSVYRYTAQSMSSFGQVLLDEGRSEVLSVSEEARAVRVHQNDAQAVRVEIELDPEGVTLLKL